MQSDALLYWVKFEIALKKNVRVTIYLLQARALQDIIKAFEQSTVNHLVGKNEMSFIRSFDLTNIIPYIQ